MIITNIKNTNYKAEKQKQPAFKGAGASYAMNYLATNETMGATFVDFMSMVFPRIAIDYTRNTEAGNETARREIFSGLLYPAAGLFGLGAGLGLNAVMENKYDVPFHKINANSDAIESLSTAFNNSLSKNKGASPKQVLRGYLEEVIDGISGQSVDKTIELKSDKTIRKEFVDDLEKLINEGEKYDIPKENKQVFHRKMLKVLGTSQNIALKVKGQEEIATNSDNLIKDIYSMGRTFTKEKVFNEFKNSKSLEDNNFVKSLKGFANKKMLIGLSAASLAGFTFQAINRSITKKKTGSDAFVGYETDGPPPEKDKSLGFKIKKGVCALGMGVLGMKTIGGKMKAIPRKLQFSGLVPNIAQYAVLYSATIMGRLLSSSDNNELRETATRDLLGFTSWLILGNLAAKGTARIFEKKHNVNLLNFDKEKHGDLKGFKKLFKSNIRTQEDVIYSSGASLKDGVKASYKKLSPNVKKVVKYLNIAQASGYVYSGLLLGVCIPILNKRITQNAMSKKLANKDVNKVQDGFSQAKFLKDKSKSFSGALTFSSFTS